MLAKTSGDDHSGHTKVRLNGMHLSSSSSSSSSAPSSASSSASSSFSPSSSSLPLMSNLELQMGGIKNSFRDWELLGNFIDNSDCDVRKKGGMNE